MHLGKSITRGVVRLDLGVEGIPLSSTRRVQGKGSHRTLDTLLSLTREVVMWRMPLSAIGPCRPSAERHWSKQRENSWVGIFASLHLHSGGGGYNCAGVAAACRPVRTYTCTGGRCRPAFGPGYVGTDLLCIVRGMQAVSHGWSARSLWCRGDCDASLPAPAQQQHTLLSRGPESVHRAQRR